MNKIIVIILLILAAVAASAQTRLGILAGGLNARQTDEVTFFRKSSDVGWQGGLVLRHDFAKAKISVEMDVLAFGCNTEFSGENRYEIVFIDEYGYKQQSSSSGRGYVNALGISLPFILKYNYKRVHPFLGFQFEVNNSRMPERNYGNDVTWVDIMGRTQTYADVIRAIPSNQDYGFLAGLEFDVTQSLGVRFTYSKGMNEVLRYDFTTGILNGEGGTKFSESTRKETFSLNVVYTPQWRKLHFKKGTEPKEKVPLKERMKELY